MAVFVERSPVPVQATEFVEKPASGTKPSKAPLYAEALRLYLTESNPNLHRIAEMVGLRALDLIDACERQNWGKRRAIILRDKSELRPAAAVAVDAQLVQATIDHVEKFTQGWQDIAGKVVALPTEPDATKYPDSDQDARNREHTRLLSRKVDLMRQVSQGVREMTEAAMVLGLAKAPTPDGKADGKLDLSKLTQLNVTINQAMAEAPQLAQAIELPTVPSGADGGF